MLVHEGKVKISGADRDRDNPKKDLAKQAWVKVAAAASIKKRRRK